MKTTTSAGTPRFTQNQRTVVKSVSANPCVHQLIKIAAIECAMLCNTISCLIHQQHLGNELLQLMVALFTKCVVPAWCKQTIIPSSISSHNFLLANTETGSCAAGKRAQCAVVAALHFGRQNQSN